MNILNSKTGLLVSLAFLCGGIQAMQQPTQKYITQVAITGSDIQDMPDRVHILPFTSLDDGMAPKKLVVEEAPGVTLNGIHDVAVNNKWQPPTEFRFTLTKPLLINLDANSPELEIVYGCAELDEPVRQYFFAEALNALGAQNVLFINLDDQDNGMRLEPVIKGG